MSFRFALACTALVVLAMTPGFADPTPSPSASTQVKRREIPIGHLMARPPEAEDPSRPVKIEQSCTEPGGRVLKKGEAGFDTCLMNAASEIQRHQQQGTKPGKPNEVGAGATTTFKIGN